MVALFKPLTHGYRVIWERHGRGTKLNYTIFFVTDEEADRKANDIRQDGYRVVKIEYTSEGAL